MQRSLLCRCVDFVCSDECFAWTTPQGILPHLVTSKMSLLNPQESKKLSLSDAKTSEAVYNSLHAFTRCLSPSRALFLEERTLESSSSPPTSSNSCPIKRLCKYTYPIAIRYNRRHPEKTSVK